MNIEGIKQKLFALDDDVLTDFVLDLYRQYPELKTNIETLVLAYPEEISNCFYTDLLQLAKKLDKQNCLLAATACYRGLLLDILKQARSKAYGHAAGYYKKLAAMAEVLQHYAPLDEHRVFVAQLKDKHGRKRSFWERAM
jgi:hypothetical protein